MAYNGYLIKVGGYTIPIQYIIYDSYKPIRSIQDLDSYRDANGLLHRNALSHELFKVEFQLRSMTNIEFDAIMNNIRAQFTTAQERKANVDCYIAETGTYTGAIPMYMPDVEVTIQQVLKNNVLKYEPITLKFIGY